MNTFSKEVINLHMVHEYTLLMQLHVDVEYPTAFNVTLDCDCDYDSLECYFSMLYILDD